MPNCFRVSLTADELRWTLGADMALWDTGASAAIEDGPNTNVALFDLAFPGSQPVEYNPDHET